MAGIYLHIPFCTKKCSYCDFYSNTNLAIVQELIDAEIEELKLRSDYNKGEKIETIYFGGGTPSILAKSQILLLLGTIYEHYKVKDDCEITFECNPDDLTNNYISELKQIGINRISIGVQSFNDEALKFLGRRHSALQADNAIRSAIQEGFNNISIDLIFGIPGMSFESYQKSLQMGIESGVKHISAYQLTFEEKTLLYKQLSNYKIKEISEEESLEQLNYTINHLNDNGFKQYEISNYAREGYISRHNWLYWSNQSYLGVGPSAHSYDGKTRQWNLSNSVKYIRQIKHGSGFYTVEQLSDIDHFNEYILTGLRTSRGVSITYIRDYFNEKINNHFMKFVKSLADDCLVKRIGDSYIVSRKGIPILDYLVKKLYFI
jgi:oxygen-independent coproporphyrinogen III oxidase